MIESIMGDRMWKNDPRDYGIVRNFESGLQDRRTVQGNLLTCTTENNAPWDNAIINSSH